jgi:DNA-binding MarR family transcriptional regulator
MSQSFPNIVHEITLQLRRRFDELASDIGIMRPQWRILLMLSEQEGPHQAGLAEALSIEQITLSRLVDQLERDGLVERRADALDRRLRRLFLTPAAAPVLNDMRAVLAQLEIDALNGLPAVSLDALTAMLEHIHQNLADCPIREHTKPAIWLASFLG